MTGLDGYRTELSVWAEGWRRVGCASVVLEIPGTGDSPADRDDPTSPDRQWSSLLDWVAGQKELDEKKVVVWAFSTGGFYAIRLAHTHPDRLKGVVALGGGVHHMFDPEWLDEVNHLEYPFEWVFRLLGHEVWLADGVATVSRTRWRTSSATGPTSSGSRRRARPSSRCSRTARWTSPAARSCFSSTYVLVETCLTTSSTFNLTYIPGHRGRNLPHRRLLPLPATRRPEGSTVSSS